MFGKDFLHRIQKIKKIKNELLKKKGKLSLIKISENFYSLKDTGTEVKTQGSTPTQKKKEKVIKRTWNFIKETRIKKMIKKKQG